MAGYIKLHRTINKWGWVTDPNMVALWIYLLTNASYENKEFLGVKLAPGQLVTGRKKMSSATGITQQTLRTCLERLKSTSEITIKSTSKYSIITIVKWSDYQDTNQVTNQRPTSDQPATNQQLTTTKEGKEIKKVKNNKITQKYSDHFVAFWNAYPNKIGEDATEKAYTKFVGKDQDLIQALLNASNRYAIAAKKKDKEYWYRGFNFINKGHWKDYTGEIKQLVPTVQKIAKLKPLPSAADIFRQLKG